MTSNIPLDQRTDAALRRLLAAIERRRREWESYREQEANLLTALANMEPPGQAGSGDEAEAGAEARILTLLDQALTVHDRVRSEAAAIMRDLERVEAELAVIVQRARTGQLTRPQLQVELIRLAESLQ